MGSRENFEATNSADLLRDSQPNNLAAYAMEREETVPSMLAIQRQSLADKGYLPSLDLDLSCGRDRLLPDDNDPGFTPSKRRQFPDLDPDPGFTPSRDRRFPDFDIDGERWTKPELPVMTPQEWRDLLAKTSVPEVTKDEVAKAEKIVDKRADVNDGPFPLSEKEQSERKRLNHAILEGNLQEIETILRSHKDDPAALSRVLAAVNEDLKEAGIQLSWQTGNMMMGNDTNFHSVGYLAIYREGNDKAISFSTDDRIATTVGGPVTWDKGQRIDRQMALPEDPNGVMKAIANQSVRALTKKK